MSQKLIIVVVVQSVLVLGLGGVALGVSMSGPSADKPHEAGHSKKKKKAPAEDPDDAEAHAEAEPDEDEAPPPRKKSKKAQPHDEETAEPPGHAKVDDVKKAAHDAKAVDAQDEKKAPVTKDAHPRGLQGKEEGHAAKEEKAEELHPLATAAPKEPLEIVAWLDEGNTRWAQGVTKQRDVAALRAQLAAKFSPWAMVVTCGDGRAVPESIFDTGPGPLTTLRAPVLKPDAAMLSAVELTLRKFEPKVLVVLGHAGCDDGSGRGIDEQVTEATAKVLGRKPVREKVKSGKVLVLRATYALDSGRVRWLDSDEGGHDETAHR